MDYRLGELVRGRATAPIGPTRPGYACGEAEA